MTSIASCKRANDLSGREKDALAKKMQLPNLLGASRHRPLKLSACTHEDHVEHQEKPCDSFGSTSVSHHSQGRREVHDDTEDVKAFVQEMRNSNFLRILAFWSPCVPSEAAPKASKEETMIGSWMYKDAALAKKKCKKIVSDHGNENVSDRFCMKTVSETRISNESTSTSKSEWSALSSAMRGPLIWGH